MLQERCHENISGNRQEKSWKENEVQKNTQFGSTYASTAQHPVPIQINGKAPINFREQGLKRTPAALAASSSSYSFQ